MLDIDWSRGDTLDALLNPGQPAGHQWANVVLCLDCNQGGVTQAADLRRAHGCTMVNESDDPTYTRVDPFFSEERGLGGSWYAP